MRALIRFSALFFCMAFYACNDKYLDLKPIDELYDGNFWRTPQDLALYCNSFYGPDMFPYVVAWDPIPIHMDEMSDDIIGVQNGNGEMTTAAGLRIVPGSGGLWSANKVVGDFSTDDWTTIRA